MQSIQHRKRRTVMQRYFSNPTIDRASLPSSKRERESQELIRLENGVEAQRKAAATIHWRTMAQQLVRFQQVVVDSTRIQLHSGLNHYHGNVSAPLFNVGALRKHQPCLLSSMHSNHPLLRVPLHSSSPSSNPINSKNLLFLTQKRPANEFHQSWIWLYQISASRIRTRLVSTSSSLKQRKHQHYWMLTTPPWSNWSMINFTELAKRVVVPFASFSMATDAPNDIDAHFFNRSTQRCPMLLGESSQRNPYSWLVSI